MQYPVIVCVGLDAEERRTADFWVEACPLVRTPELHRPGELTQGCNVLFSGTAADVSAVLEWRLPLVIVPGRSVPSRQLDDWLSAGAAAVFRPEPKAEGVFVLPPLALPEVHGSIFVVSDDEDQRRRLRQLFRFCGYDLRADFRSAEEMIEVLRGLHESGGPERAFPELLVLDLDSRRVDVPAFFHRLRTLRQEQPTLVRRTRVVVTKDFQRPGADVRALAANLKAFARRIYHPLEAAFVFLEGLAYRSEQRTVNYRSPAYRPTAEIVFGDGGKFPAVSPDAPLSTLAAESARYRRGLLFTTLHTFLERAASEGAVLAPQPDVDSGNLLNGVRGPNSTRMGLENAGE